MYSRIIFSFFFLLFATLFLLRFHIVGQAVYGDGRYYWAYTRSIVIDHNLDLRNEGSHMYSPETNNKLSSIPEKISKNSDIRTDKYYPIGTSLAWIPFFFVAHIFVIFLHLFHLPLVQNGYSDIYQITVGLGNIFLVCTGLTMLFAKLQKYFTKKIALISVLAVGFGTNLIYYGSLDVLTSHASAFFLSTLFLFLWIQTKNTRSKKIYMLFGLLIGFMSTVRTQDTIFLAFLLPEAIMHIAKAKKRTKEIKNWTIIGLFTLLGFFLGFLPQIITSKILYGTFFLLPYSLGKTGFFLNGFHGLDILLDAEKGFLFYSPLFLVGVLGLLFFYKKEKNLPLSSLLVILLTYFTVSVWSGWSQGEAFGMRMFISLYPLATFGIAEVTARLSAKLSFKVIFCLIFLFIMQNMIMIANFHLFLHNPTYVGSELSQSGKLKNKLLQYFHQSKK